MSSLMKSTIVTEPKTETPLPPIKSRIRQWLSGPALMHYHRLVVLMWALNLVAAYTLPLSFESIQSLILLNFAAATLIRNQYVINGLFKAATSVPLSWPLAIRRRLAKVYHFGGVHVGGFTAGAAWMLASLFQTTHFAQISLIGVHLVVLGTIMVVSLPQIREKHHDLFEKVARFGNWMSLSLFWAQAITLTESPSFTTIGILSVVTFSVLQPWLRLRRVPVESLTPSSHVSISKFHHVTPFAGSSCELSLNPLFEWHSFANIPSPDQEGFRLAISRAGDWTGQWIDKKPKSVWVKGIPTAGVGNIERCFKKVIWVATGSGIGPCLPHLLSKEVPSQLIWSTRSPRKTYGNGLVNEIFSSQPEAIVWDTDLKGKPNMLDLVYQTFRDSDAEAVICISNKKLTWQVVSGLESRGIPAYGAIWDS